MAGGTESFVDRVCEFCQATHGAGRDVARGFLSFAHQCIFQSRPEAVHLRDQVRIKDVNGTAAVMLLEEFGVNSIIFVVRDGPKKLTTRLVVKEAGQGI
jgi:hypothetical protein